MATLLDFGKIDTALFTRQTLKTIACSELADDACKPIKSYLFQSWPQENPTNNEQVINQEQVVNQAPEYLFPHRCHELLKQILQRRQKAYNTAPYQSRRQMLHKIQELTGAPQIHLYENEPTSTVINTVLQNQMGKQNHTLGVNLLLGQHYINTHNHIKLTLCFNSITHMNQTKNSASLHSKINGYFPGLKTSLCFELCYQQRPVIGKLLLGV